MPVSSDSSPVPQARCYRLDPSSFSEFRRNLIIRSAIVAPFLLAAIWYMDGRVKPHRGLFDFVLLPVILMIVVYRQIEREREKWGALEFELRNESLVRRLTDYPDLEIAQADVTAIVESSRGITIKTKDRQNTLFLGRELLDYDDLSSRLTAWAPGAKVIQKRSSVFNSFASAGWSILWCMAVFGSPFYVMYTPHREQVLPLGIAIFAGYAAMIFYVRRSPNVSVSARNTVWLLLALPLLAMIVRLG